jgi:hypothetical protein
MIAGDSRRYRTLIPVIVFRAEFSKTTLTVQAFLLEYGETLDTM